LYRIVEKERQRGCPSFRICTAKPDLPASFFASQIIRPAIGIILYIVATALGWFAHPLLAVAIFMLIVGYYAWTSQGIHPGR
jgi:hypothetical protein